MSDTYKMTVDLNVLDHLGINLYSNIAAVLTEAVANAWDADAENVTIIIDTDKKSISIKDDGIGMSITEMNDRYLRVGYRRREDSLATGRVTTKGRPVMGRKGLGKLSLFSIANTIFVLSSNGSEKHGLKMTVEGIRRSVSDRKDHYSPDVLAADVVDKSFKRPRGTTIVLHDVKRERLGKGITALRKRLARRFSIIGQVHKFEITINDEPITATDRGDLATLQFLWRLQGSEVELPSSSKVQNVEELPNRLKEWPEDWKVKGWIGTARTPKQLDSEEEGNLNGIVVFARGRLFHENVLDKLNDGRLYTKYLTGQIEADFLDDDDEPDIATSDRQRVQEDDPRYVALIAFLKSSLSQLERRWSERRGRQEIEEAKQTIPALAEWFESLSPGHKKSAETLIAKLSALPIDKEEDRKLLYRHGVLAFERMKLRGSTEELAKSMENVEQLIAILADADSLEAALYRDIVKSRLEVIKRFQAIVDDDDREKVLQEYLFDHLWLLDPAWERAATTAVMETRLLDSGIIVTDLTEKEKLSRVDIAYRTIAGKHIVVELKKAGRQMELIELQAQGQTYVDKLTKILLSQNETNPNIEVIFVIGKPVAEEASNPDRLKSSMAAVSPGSRIVHYDSLIRGAQEAYSEYLSKSRSMDRLERIVEGI